MTTQASTLEKLAQQLLEIPNVKSANVWEKTTEKRQISRIYIELPKLNGGKNWNGGKAGTVFYDLDADKIITVGDWAGAKTRNLALDVLRDIKSKLGIDFEFRT